MKKIFVIILVNVLVLNIYSQSQNAVESMNLMPFPKDISIQTGNFIITEDFTINIQGNPDQRIYKAATRFLRNISNRTGVFIDQGFVSNDSKSNNPSLLIAVNRPGNVELYEDESYNLTVNPSTITLKANTDLGALHGLSTLMQLLTVKNNVYVFPSVKIIDNPRFAWRGLMIDVARHFMPVDVIKRNLDAMAYVKLNVFHWHLSDDQGFRFESEKLPLLTEKASDNQYYSQEQIKDIVTYAADRGIRVIPEIDVPGHGTAFATAYPEIASKDTIYTLERYAGIFDPTLDPTNERTYEILDILFTEMASIFPDPYFHIGGDENEGKHWDENKDIQKFMKKKSLKDNHELQTYFNIRLQKILEREGKIMMGWDEIMTENMPKNAIIHSWRTVGKGEDLKQIEAAKKGYQTVLSNGYYIDLMKPASSHYIKDPIPEGVELSDEVKQKIIGGEATMWSELVTPLTIDSRIWPRTAAIAERFWSPREVNDVDFMYKRLEDLNNQLEAVGIMNIRNRNVILRNISNNHNIESLIKLVNISEPIKIYTRNKGGTQYKSYSPFTLFADACNVDAKGVTEFDQQVVNYKRVQSDLNKKQIEETLLSWIQIDKDLHKIAKKAPIVSVAILPYSGRISEISNIFLKGISEGEFTVEEYKKVLELLDSKEDPEQNLDVELAVNDTLQKLAEFLQKR